MSEIATLLDVIAKPEAAWIASWVVYGLFFSAGASVALRIDYWLRRRAERKASGTVNGPANARALLKWDERGNMLPPTALDNTHHCYAQPYIDRVLILVGFNRPIPEGHIQVASNIRNLRWMESHMSERHVVVIAEGKLAGGFIHVEIVPPSAASGRRQQERAWQDVIYLEDAFAGYNRLYGADRQPGPITAVSCWAHARRKFFVLADIAANAKRGQDAPPISPLALEAVKRIDALFDIERAINGKSPEQRLAARQEHSAPRVAELETWMRTERARLSRHTPVAKAMDYMLRRWDTFTAFLRDGRGGPILRLGDQSFDLVILIGELRQKIRHIDGYRDSAFANAFETILKSGLL